LRPLPWLPTPSSICLDELLLGGQASFFPRTTGSHPSAPLLFLLRRDVDIFLTGPSWPPLAGWALSAISSFFFERRNCLVLADWQPFLPPPLFRGLLFSRSFFVPNLPVRGPARARKDTARHEIYYLLKTLWLFRETFSFSLLPPGRLAFCKHPVAPRLPHTTRSSPVHR